MTDKILTIGDLEKAIEGRIVELKTALEELKNFVIVMHSGKWDERDYLNSEMIKAQISELETVLEKIGELTTYIKQKIEDGKCVSWASSRCDYTLCLTCPIKADGLQEILWGKFREPSVKKSPGDDKSG